MDTKQDKKRVIKMLLADNKAAERSTVSSQQSRRDSNPISIKKLSFLGECNHHHHHHHHLRLVKSCQNATYIIYQIEEK